MTNLDFIDTCVVGAGVVGLAIARELALRNHNVLVIDKADRFGDGISSRNSEVIHAGIYYPRDSLKASLCVRGKQLLYDYCSSRNIQHRKLGKLIVATSMAEEEQLTDILAKAEANEVTDLEYVSAAELARIEPAVQATLALRSPSTGIISAHDLMTAFLGDLEAEGGTLACHTTLESVVQTTTGFILHTSIDGESFSLGCRNLINSAGLNAQAVAAAIEGFSADMIPNRHLCKGSYFLLQGRNPFTHLIYPVPDPSGAGLGVHATIDIGGQVKFGPDVEYIESEDYSVTDEQLEKSYRAIRRYFPGLPDDALTPGYAGIRPKLQGPSDAPVDFVIQGQDKHGVQGLVNLYGIESPGLTSSMAIAETVAQQLGDI